MRLLNVHTFEIHTFHGQDIPRYGILSHTWGEDEVSFAKFQDEFGEACRMKGFQKIQFTCEQARSDGLNYAWIDTICIDKSSSTELSEAINSMFKWYRDATVCYVFLIDIIKDRTDFTSSRWWIRAWTLQELIAPVTVQFYDCSWKSLGTKEDRLLVISNRTGIDIDTLKDPGCRMRNSIARRMSWAAGRQATRVEDIAYSLLGIFDVHIGLLYGEGDIAFFRLQQEILRVSEDQSLFAWGQSNQQSSWGALATSPDQFQASGDIKPIQSDHTHPPSSMTNRGTQVNLFLF
ncbi:HET-domain-containing protein, partial [Cenococcum geophilum 1.58]